MMKLATTSLALLAGLAAATHHKPKTPEVFDLGNSEWTLSSQPPNVTVPGFVPSHVHLDLLKAGVIDDPYYGMNDFEQRWVAWSNWTYTSAPLRNLAHSDDTTTWLVFNGLDTFADVHFCGKYVGSTNNQFRQFYFDVSTLLEECDQYHPTLSIDFGSAPIIAEQIANEPGQETWPWGVNQLYEIHNRHFIRKEQNDFGWDWGPAFAPAGVWQPAYVVQLSGEDQDSTPLYVRNSVYDIYRKGQLNSLIPDQSAPWVLNASMDYLGSGSPPCDVSLCYTVKHTNGSVVTKGELSDITVTDDTISGATTLDPSLFELWWPLGMGPQNLYNVTVDVISKEGRTLASTNKRTGFRTIVLNQGEITPEQIAQGIAPGSNWHFEINGHEFYAKGSNFIPPDVFWPRVTEERMLQLFDSIVDGNQNMLRVWSSGAYLPDFIFDIADATGVLLWSEFQFGCSLYPVDKPFLENVADEAYYNVRRVNHHPSLALWAGGNELENLVLPTAKKADPESYPKYLAEYETLFMDVLLHQVYQNTRSISYTPSSTSNGYLSLDHSRPNPLIQRYDNITEGHYYSDTDHYNYNSSEAFDTSAYPRGRFANEFGYHSMPSLQTWREVIPPEELFFNSSTIVLGHMRHYPPGNLNTTNWDNATIGMVEMTVPIELYYPIPEKSDSVANFTAWCWTTQIFQAEFYRSQIQYYRRGSGLGERQLGSLYWQLEDQWQGPTWAGIEHNGRWKFLHYGAKDIYEPIIVSPFYNSTTGDLSVWVTSDLWSPAKGTVNLAWYDWSGNPLEATKHTPASKSFEVGGLNSTQVFHTNIKDKSSIDLTNAVLYMNVTAEGTFPNTADDQIVTFNHENFFSPVPLSEAKIVDPGLSIDYSEETGNFTVKATNGIAAWTWLDYDNNEEVGVKTVGNFDTNGFWLLPGRERQVSFKVKTDDTDGGWVDTVTVQSIWNNTLKE